MLFFCVLYLTTLQLCRGGGGEMTPPSIVVIGRGLIMYCNHNLSLALFSNEKNWEKLDVNVRCGFI